MQKKRKITQEKESRERKPVNFPNEEGVGVGSSTYGKTRGKRWWCPRLCVPFSFSFEGSDMRVEGEEEEEGDAMEIVQTKQGVCQNNPSKERE